MNTALWSYALFVLLAAAAVVALAGLGRVRRITNLIGWFLFVFLLTYIVRPAVQEWTQDFELYDLLDINPLQEQWGKMTLAVSLSLLCLGVGYSFANRGKSRRVCHSLSFGQQRNAYRLAIGLCLWGYAAVVLSRDSASHVASDELTGYGIMVGSTAWLTSSDLFISTGSALMYILNRRLVSSLAIALPWLLLRIAGGYGRTAIIGHAMSLLAVWGMASPGVRNVVSSRVRQGTQLLLLFGGVAVIALVIFPAIGQNRGFFARGFNSETVNEALQVNQTAGDVAHSVGDLAGFETTLYFLQLDQPVWGTYYLYFYFLKPIPRAIFPDKGFPDTLAAKWFGVERDLRLSGQDSGCVGWAFQQWSWGGIVFEFLLTGWLFRKLEDWRDDFPDRLWVLLAYAGFFGILPQLGRDSVIVMIEDRWLFQYGIPCAVLWWIERTNRVRSYANQPMILSIGEATFPSERLPAPQGAPSETFG